MSEYNPSEYVTIPEGWSCKRLADCTTDGNISYGIVQPGQHDNDGIPIIRVNNVKNGQLDLSDVLKVSPQIEKKYERTRLKGGEVLLTLVGSTGQSFVAPNDLAGWNVPRAIAVIKACKDVGADWINICLQSQETKHFLDVRANTTVQKTLNLKDVRDIPILIPPEGVKKAIERTALSTSCKIELNRQTNQTLEQIAQAIFKSWFVDFEPTRAKIAAKENGQDPERAAMCAISGKSLDELEQLGSEQIEKLQTTAALFPDALVESELGDIPEGWRFKKLKDICRVLNGRAYKNSEFKTEGTPIVRIQNLSKAGKTVYSDLDLPLDKLIHKEDFIYAWSATFGPHIWRGPKSIYHYHIWKMDVDETVISRYFLYLSMFRKTEQMKSGATGSIFTHLTKGIMESQDILIASHELNMLFKKYLEEQFLKISALENESNELKAIRNTLLPKLLSGELSPSQQTPATDSKDDMLPPQELAGATP